MKLYTIPLSRSIKQILLMVVDAIMIVTAVAFSFALLGKDFFGQDQGFYFYLSLATTVSILVFIRIGLYRALILYMGLQSGFLICKELQLLVVCLPPLIFSRKLLILQIYPSCQFFG